MVLSLLEMLMLVPPHPIALNAVMPPELARLSNASSVQKQR